MLKDLNNKNKHSTFRHGSGQAVSCSGEKAFTLIELLVVISVIGLLSMIALANLSSSKEKARIAGGQQLSGSMRTGLGYYLVGEWGFSGGTASDTSGYDNDGTIYGATPMTNCISGDCLGFDGSSDYVRIPISLSSQEVTGEVWVMVNSAGLKDGILNGSGYSFHMWVNIDGTFNFGAWTTSTNEEKTSTQTFSFGVWRHVVVVNKGGEFTKLYVDGKLIDTFSLTGNLRDISFFEIGRHPGYDGNYFNGAIDEVRVYDTALTLGQIQQNYAEGLERHRDLAMAERGVK